jgi:hypothetical protein
MFGIMILSGLLSTMSIWADKFDDVRFSLNDVYMILLMTGWMYFFTGLFDKNWSTLAFGAILAVVSFWCIRTQFLISPTQFLTGMIPHHSMAVHMSRKLLERGPSELSAFAKTIVDQQEKEIRFMKAAVQ